LTAVSGSFDPEDGTTSDIGLKLQSRKREKIGDWETAWKTLFPEDVPPVPDPGLSLIHSILSPPLSNVFKTSKMLSRTMNSSETYSETHKDGVHSWWII
jgi:hypothetical protein